MPPISKIQFAELVEFIFPFIVRLPADNPGEIVPALLKFVVLIVNVPTPLIAPPELLLKLVPERVAVEPLSRIIFPLLLKIPLVYVIVVTVFGSNRINPPLSKFALSDRVEPEPV